MSEQLTSAELQVIYDVFRGDSPEDAQIDDALWDSVAAKMAGGLQALEKQKAEAKGMVEESFPHRITQEEAHLYQQKGMRMMQEAAKQKLTEIEHADLSCLFTAIIGGISQATGVPREVFSNTMVANVAFTALKAAMFYGRPRDNNLEDSTNADGPSRAPVHN